MAYTEKNYKTKKAVVQDFKAGIKIPVFQPGPFGPTVKDGRCSLEGPHYPEAHKWYLSVEVENGHITHINR